MASDQNMMCPKCGAFQKKKAVCEKCGVVVDKFQSTAQETTQTMFYGHYGSLLKVLLI